MAFGMSPEGGSTNSRHATRTSESELNIYLRPTRGIGGARWGGRSSRSWTSPESLSFDGSLALVGVLRDIVKSDKAQAIVATHSPIVAATPGADLFEVGPWGLRPSSWDELGVVRIWRSFLQDPDRFLRHLD